MFTIKYQKSKEIFYIILEGKLEAAQTLTYLDLICNAGIQSHNITIIVDYRQAVLNESSSKPINDIAKFINTKLKYKFEHIKWAGLAENPMFITGLLILKSLVADSKLDIEPFSTQESLHHWLNLSNKDFDEFELLFESKLR